MEVQRMLSEKGKELLVFNGAKFFKANVLQSGRIRWRCMQKLCAARIYTDVSGKCLELDLNHNHPIDEATLARQKFSNSVKRKAKKDISARPSKLIRVEMQDNPDSLSQISLEDIRSIRKTICRARKSLIPALPEITAIPIKYSDDTVTQPDKEWKTYMNSRNKIAGTCSSSVADSNYDDEHSQLLDDGSIKTEIKTEIDVEDTEISLSNDESRLHSDDDSKDNIVKCTEDSEEPLAKKSRYGISHIKEEIPEEPGEADNIEIKEETPAEECDVQERLLSEQQGKEIGERAIETFFKSMAATVMTFPPHLIAETRLRVCEIVSEIELRLLTERQRDRDYV